MQLAFYAPMKAPDHPVPSGDRSIARALLAALRRTGAHVSLPSSLRSRDGKGDSAVQAAVQAAADAEIDRLLPLGRTADWQAWITYHNYYKAPDLIGPAVSKGLGIPYVQIESTRARKRLSGPWAAFAKAAEAASDAADVIFYFSTRDAVGLKENAHATQRLIHLRPFLSRDTLPRTGPGNGPMLSVGMMRAGDKIASFQIIADTLALLVTPDWRLDIAGDGPARHEVEHMMQPFGNRIKFLGQLDPPTLQSTYQNSSLMFWPGVNEALGMVYLEAQATGLPVVAQDRPGMREVIAPADYPTPQTGATALAQMLDDLLGQPEKRQQMGQDAQTYVLENHLMPSATDTLRDGLASIGVAT